MARNYLLSVFLSDERFTHALFLGSDLSFEPEQFFRLLDFDEDFVAAVYPDRQGGTCSGDNTYGCMYYTHACMYYTHVCMYVCMYV